MGFGWWAAFCWSFAAPKQVRNRYSTDFPLKDRGSRFLLGGGREAGITTTNVYNILGQLVAEGGGAISVGDPLSDPRRPGQLPGRDRGGPVGPLPRRLPALRGGGTTYGGRASTRKAIPFKFKKGIPKTYPRRGSSFGSPAPRFLWTVI